jgi:hypothetical protein
MVYNFCPPFFHFILLIRILKKEELYTDIYEGGLIMKMIEVNGSMSEELVNGVQSAKSYLDGKTDIAMLSENVFVILDETKASDGVEEVCEAVRRYIDDIFSYHPDFSCYRMADGHMLIGVGHVVAFGKEEITEEDFGNPQVRMMNALALRNDLFEVCEKAQILAIVDANENN